MFDSKTQKRKHELKFLAAYIDKGLMHELDLRALVCGQSRSALLLDIVKMHMQKNPWKSVIKDAAQIIYEDWDKRCEADPQIRASLQVRRNVFYTMCEESRVKLRKKKISAEHIDAIILQLRVLAKVG